MSRSQRWASLREVAILEKAGFKLQWIYSVSTILPQFKILNLLERGRRIVYIRGCLVVLLGTI